MLKFITRVFRPAWTVGGQGAWGHAQEAMQGKAQGKAKEIFSNKEPYSQELFLSSLNVGRLITAGPIRGGSVKVSSDLFLKYACPESSPTKIGKSSFSLKDVVICDAFKIFREFFKWDATKEFYRGLSTDPDFACMIKTLGGRVTVRGMGEDECAGVRGQGGFGRVLVGELNGEEIAVKFIRLFPQNTEEVEREIDLLLKMQGALNVMGAKEAVYITDSKTGKPACVAIVMDRADGNFFDLEVRMAPSVKMKVALGAARGLLEMHNKNIIHRDIKPDNILIKMDAFELKEVKIADLGGSIEGFQVADDDIAGTQGYMAPEVVEKRLALQQGKDLGALENPGKPSDIYSMGITLFKIFSSEEGKKRCLIFQKADKMEGAFSCEEEDFLHFEEPVRQKIFGLVKSCLESNPADRPTSQELVQKLEEIDGLDSK